MATLSTLIPVTSFSADDGSQLNEKFRINYAGYLPEASKTAFYLANNSGPISWSISALNCSGTSDSYVANDKSSGDSFYVIDFSECTDKGNNLRLQVGADQSQNFDISDDPYGNIKYEFFDYFKDHEGNATFDQTVNNWSSGLSTTFSYVKDAGDDGVYPTNTAEAAWALINMLETYPTINTYYSSNLNGARTVYDQLKVLTEQFNHVFDHSGKLAIAKFHTNVNTTWALCAPHSSGSCISEPETKATYATARTLAAMARLHNQYGSSNEANAAYQSAKTSYENASTTALVCNQPDSFGGEGGFYPDNDNYSIVRDPKSERDHCVADRDNTEDDQYTALVELYISAVVLGQITDAANYKGIMTAHARFNEASSYSWSRVVMEGNLSLLTNESKHDIDLSTLKTNILAKSDEIMQFQNKGYPGVTWDDQSNFWDSGDQDDADNNVRWGSHRNALNDARILMAAAHIQTQLNQRTASAQYARFAIKVLDHISGLNPMALTMYTTSGYSQFEHSIERTHDNADVDDMWAGKMVLGPNNWTNANDPDMPDFNSLPGLKMFAVTGAGWGSREISIDANASLVPVAYFTTEVAPAILAAAPIGGLPDPVNVPAAPANVAISNVQHNALTLSWADASGSNDDLAQSFSIYQSQSNSIPALPIQTVDAGQTSIDVTGLQPEMTYYFWVVANNIVGASLASSAFASTLVEPPVMNLISNGAFDNANSLWVCTVTGDATCNIVNEEFVVNIVNGGTLDWHVQPNYEGISLVSGQTYTFAFDAKAQGARDANIKVERGSTPWDDFSQVGVGQSLTTQMQRFVYTFTMTETVNNARVAMNIGASNQDITVDNIWLAQTNIDPCNGIVGCSEPVTTYAISVVQTPNGTISPSSVVLNEGETQLFSITPNNGYIVSDVLIDGVSQGAVTEVTLSNVKAMHEISATFAQNQVSSSLVAVTQPANGSVTPASATILQGDVQLFQIAVDQGYEIENVIKNGVSLGSISQIEFSYLDQAQSLEVTTKQIPIDSTTYHISVSQSQGGTISSASVDVVNGQTFTFTITPNAGYEIDSILKNSQAISNSNTVEFLDMGVDQTLLVNFKESTNQSGIFNINMSVRGQGSVSPQINSAAQGQDVPLFFVPAQGHEIDEVIVNGMSLGKLSSINLSNIQSDQNIEVVFKSISVEEEKEAKKWYSVGSTPPIWLFCILLIPLIRRSKR